MSDYETRVGNIRPTELSVDEVVYQWLDNNEKPKYYNLPEDNLELFRSEIENYVFINDIVYEIIDDKRLDYDDLFEINENPDGTLSYILRYYNGGCGYEEALESAMDKFNKNGLESIKQKQ